MLHRFYFLSHSSKLCHPIGRFLDFAAKLHAIFSTNCIPINDGVYPRNITQGTLTVGRT